MTILRITTLMSTFLLGVMAHAQSFAPEVGQWELRTQLTNVSLDHTARSESSESIGSNTNIGLGAGLYRQMDESLLLGSSVWLGRSSSRNAAGDSNGTTGTFQVVPTLEYLVNDSVGIGGQVHLRIERDSDGDGELLGTGRQLMLQPYLFYRVPVNESLRTDFRGGFGWYQYQEFDGDGEETYIESEYWFVLSAFTKYYPAPNFSLNFDPRLFYGKYDLENDNTDRSRVSFRTHLGFSFYF